MIFYGVMPYVPLSIRYLIERPKILATPAASVNGLYKISAIEACRLVRKKVNTIDALFHRLLLLR